MLPAHYRNTLYVDIPCSTGICFVKDLAIVKCSCARAVHGRSEGIKCRRESPRRLARYKLNIMPSHGHRHETSIGSSLHVKVYCFLASPMPRPYMRVTLEHCCSGFACANYFKCRVVDTLLRNDEMKRQRQSLVYVPAIEDFITDHDWISRVKRFDALSRE